MAQPNKTLDSKQVGLILMSGLSIAKGTFLVSGYF